MLSLYLQNKFKVWGIIAVATVGFAGYYYAYRKGIQNSKKIKENSKENGKKQ